MMELMLSRLDCLQEDITERKDERNAFREEMRNNPGNAYSHAIYRNILIMAILDLLWFII
jgi:hypothetical protein